MCFFNVLKAEMCLDEVFSNPLSGEKWSQKSAEMRLHGLEIYFSMFEIFSNINIYA